jgi:hypothetical protein
LDVKGRTLDPDWSCLFGQWTGMCRCGLIMDRLRQCVSFMYRTPTRSVTWRVHFGSGHGRGWSY